jgi:hypothetical protein
MTAANANVPPRSKTSSTDPSDIARVYRIRTGQPSQVVIIGGSRLIDKHGMYEPLPRPALTIPVSKPAASST